MIVETIVASCDEPGCLATAPMPKDGWIDLGTRDLCPKHARPRVAEAEAARAALTRPLPDARRMVPARGTRRRLQALVAIGWHPTSLRAALCTSGPAFERLMQDGEVVEGQARRVAVLYQRLQLLTPPRTTAAEERDYLDALAHARPRRWVTPMGWDDIDRDEEPPVAEVAADDIDETAIELAIAGEKPRLNHAERREATRRLHAERWSDPLIANHLGLSDRTVCRIRQELGLPGLTQDEWEPLRRSAA